MSDTTTIPLTKRTRNRLREWGRKGETYDALLNRLLDSIEAQRIVEFRPIEE